MTKLLLIDGNALMHRAYHAIPPLTTATGEQVNAVFGFTSLFLRALNDLKPDCVVFTFDRPSPTFRHHAYAQYKATRQKMEDDLAAQIPRLQQVAAAFGFPVYELDGYEADDLIGTITRQACEASTENFVYIMTADMDAAQLVNGQVSIYTAKQKISEVITYDEAGIEVKFNGLKPNQIVDYKALRGDTSDNIPGVQGVGEKTATDLLMTYGTLDKVYQSLDQLKPRTKQLLEAGKESAYLSQTLATINTEAPIVVNLQDCHVSRFDRGAILELFHELEFRSLINKLPEDPEASSVQSPTALETAAIATNYQLVDSVAELQALVDNIKKQSAIAFDTETTGVNIWDASLIGVSCSWEKGSGYYIVYRPEYKSLLKDWLEDPAIAKIAHNAKFDCQALFKEGISVANVNFDTMLAAYILKEGTARYGLKELAYSELGINATPISELIGTGSKQTTLDLVSPEDVAQYASADADHTWQLYQIFSQQMAENTQAHKLFREIELPASVVLASMEEAGIRLDQNLLQQMSGELAQQLQQLESDIYRNVGHEFNLNSPKQLGDVLFDELKLPSNKKTKTGRSTNESVLQSLKGLHPIIEDLLQYREMYKLKSTYVDALPALVSRYDNRLHTSYNQAVAATGRLSSSNPNLQNIPIKTEVGRKIRQAFIPDEGHKLLSVDYSQIELRLLAHMAQDHGLIEAFKQGQDIHAATAAKVFDCPIDEVSSSQRRAAKTINFGIMYGQSSYGLSQQLGTTREAAAKFIHDYFQVYASVKQYIDSTIKLAHQHGYVETLYGRRRRVPELSSPNFQLRQAAERMAFNMPIQGTAADIIKIAMINLHRQFAEQSFKSKMLLQVHDELVFTVHPNEEEQVVSLVVNSMQDAAQLSVKLEVEAKVGVNWGEMTPL
jgi:DNA polymerase I